MEEKNAIRQSMGMEETDIRRYIGIDFSCTDGGRTPPVETQLDSSNALEWFESYPESVECPAIRLLVFEMKPQSSKQAFDIPFSQKYINHVLWLPEVYTDMAKLPSGGCAALPDDLFRFVLQTPLDGQPFASLAMSKRGHICKGIYAYDHPDFEPTQMMVGEHIYSGWRGDGLQIVSVPQSILRANSAWLAQKLGAILGQIEEVEAALASPFVEDFFNLQRTLHLCHDALFALERRSSFENVMIEALESIVMKSLHGRRGPWTALAPAKAALKIRRTDLESIPRRVENARAAINDNILQRTQLQSLELARSTQRIAEATMNDSASMKTIAILTMIFLPGTAVASFFSMTMWDWSPDNDGSLASPWLWIYFVVAMPLTLGVIAFWWVFMKLRTKNMQTYLPTIMSNAAPPYASSIRNLDRKID